MPRHHFFRAGIFCISIALVGCNSSQPATRPSSETLTPVPVVSDAAKSEDPSIDEATLLARRTAKYVQETSPMLGKNAAPAVAPSTVKFVDPVNKTAGVPQKPVPAAAAHQAAYVQKQGSDDVPQILPESADHIPNAAPPAITMATDEYERKLQKQVQDYPKDLGGQLDYELLRFVRAETTPDLASIAGLTSEDREIAAALLDGLSNFRNTVRADNNLLLSRKIQPLMDMADRLRSQAELTVPTVALCTKVDSFGVYTPVTASRFAAGKENAVIIYTEVGNFSSAPDDHQIWETHLRQEMVLYTETGMPVWPAQSNAQSFTDKAHSRRHDFFLARIARLPANLTIGRYLMKVTITDEQTHRVAEVSAPIQIVAE